MYIFSEFPGSSHSEASRQHLQPSPWVLWRIWPVRDCGQRRWTQQTQRCVQEVLLEGSHEWLVELDNGTMVGLAFWFFLRLQCNKNFVKTSWRCACYTKFLCSVKLEINYLPWFTPYCCNSSTFWAFLDIFAIIVVVVVVFDLSINNLCNSGGGKDITGITYFLKSNLWHLTLTSSGGGTDRRSSWRTTGPQERALIATQIQGEKKWGEKKITAHGSRSLRTQTYFQMSLVTAVNTATARETTFLFFLRAL